MNEGSGSGDVGPWMMSVVHLKFASDDDRLMTETLAHVLSFS